MPNHRNSDDNVSDVGDEPTCKCLVEGSDSLDSSAEGIITNPPETSTAKLTVLNLSGQGLTSFPQIEELPNLHILDLSSNDLTELPSRLRSARFLRVLDASSNKLTEFPEVLTDGLHILRELNLSRNAIKTLQRPQCYQHLRVLRAKHCSIPEFPLWILYELHFLEVLDLSSNDIFYRTALNHKRFHQSCNNLKWVDFSNTCFSDSNVSIVSRFHQLEYLDVSNYTQRFTNSFAGFDNNLPPALKVLKATNCRMIQMANLRITQTKKANLSGNPLGSLNPIDLSTHLRYLTLNSCFLVCLPDNFGDLSQLVYLNVSNNELCYLPDSFSSLKQLVHLDLYQNSFTDFPDSEVEPLKGLTCFDMCLNPCEVPLYPLGEEAPSYATLRGRLRSSLSYCRKTGRTPSSERYSGVSPEDHLYFDSSEDDDEDSEEVDLTHPSSPSAEVANNPEEEEDWDTHDPDEIYYRNLPPTPFLKDPFAGEFDEELTRWTFRLVPRHIRNSPFFFHRHQQPTVVPNHREEEEVAEGQFDDA